MFWKIPRGARAAEACGVWDFCPAGGALRWTARRPRALPGRRGIALDSAPTQSHARHQEQQCDILVRAMRKSLDLEKIYHLLEEKTYG